MIKILIVDDFKPKRDKIVKTILDNHDMLEKDIIQAKNTKEARKILYKEYFDLMILDLVLPIEELGECRAKHGVDFLNEIGINPSINPPIHIVGISGYKDQVSEFNQSFSKKLWNLIEYEECSSSWEDQLKSIIFHLVRTRQQFISASFSNQSEIIIDHLEQNNLPNTLIGFKWNDVAENIATIVEKSLEVPAKFSNGSKAKNINVSSIKISSEYDYQNLIHLVLRPWLPSLEPENIAIVYDGNTKNADFSIKNNSLIIEAKYIDSTGKKNDTLKTLEGLKKFYSQNANVKALLFLILVEDGFEIDKYKIESEFSQKSTEPSICIKVMYNKLK
jgi:Chemotaxis response regulator containing a CheY-like receiver domain and a methylesterase domain